MEQIWVDDSDHRKFWRQLLNSRVDELVKSVDWLKRLRYRHEEVKWWNRRCGHIFEERGLLIAQAHGECWDDEDEQKCAHALSENVLPPLLKEKPRHAVSLDHPLQSSVRERQEKEPKLQVLPGDERRQSKLQAGREELYRRAGGICP